MMMHRGAGMGLRDHDGCAYIVGFVDYGVLADHSLALAAAGCDLGGLGDMDWWWHNGRFGVEVILLAP